ncbi:MAG: magnesium/cobalt transporter CorA [Pseudothermotoga sp.]|uniref:magnesium/cobalt transporter CorA n=1 Tax=Pseudothermotoga sp. TaxID=2033661 RepID=UPI00076C1F92|nr:MAG: Magnesium and cobalt transport protein CorA [Thermotoga sp. 50_64]MBC7116180.1 magnesium/cobalt transporter CorA [Pseudothermotoga sp.]HBT38796.1 magnesium and cobalt transport protein CorA [Pseudothermotoga sp.]HCO98309.1 magnesium and cobalt transport protein CorA [Pseudothermotoga sp.]
MSVFGKIRRAEKAGLPPGSVIFIGEQKTEFARIDVIDFNEAQLNEVRDASIDQCVEMARNPSTVTWINVIGLHDTNLIRKLGESLGLHPLTMEDIANTTQRPKVEEFPGYIYMVLKIIRYEEVTNQMEVEQVSLVIEENYVASFQEVEEDVFNPVRERIRASKGRIRSMKSDYLAYALMDAVVDSYFLVVEHIGDKIEELEEKVLSDPNPAILQELHRLKRGLLDIRKSVWPLREEIGSLIKSESTIIRAETKVYLRDLYDHVVQIIDMVETFRDILSGMHDLYLSNISIRMNDIMKTLTIIATIFIPLTFIAGIYGMNFEYMPELKWKWGYFFVWGVMITIAIGMVIYFRKKKWL